MVAVYPVIIQQCNSNASNSNAHIYIKYKKNRQHVHNILKIYSDDNISDRSSKLERYEIIMQQWKAYINKQL